MEDKKLKTYNEEVISFCHKNFIINNLKNELIREFVPICSNWKDLSNEIDDAFENCFKSEVYPKLDSFKDTVSLSAICNMCMVSIVNNINHIRMKLYGHCIDQIYSDKTERIVTMMPGAKKI